MDKVNQDEQNTVDGILRKIEAKADTGEYLYRGEPECYEEDPYLGKVSSNLYRVFFDDKDDKDFDVETEHFDIEVVEAEVLEMAKLFSRKTADELEHLAEIQHYGGKTNLIDFTEDYLVALFMACNSSLDKDGRVILQRKDMVNFYIKDPYEPKNRVIAQKSIFVQHPDGSFQPNKNDVINIPPNLKHPILRHLRNSHGISVETIYNDIHGFIRHQRLNPEVYRTIYEGLAQKQKGDSEHDG